MKREQLKKLIKPIIKECIHEVIIESGVLSSVVTEVAKGMGNVIVESPQPVPALKPQVNHNQEAIALQKKKLATHKKKLNEAIGNDAYKGIFEGLDPMDAPKDTSGAPGGALAGVPATDAGVDISGIVSLSGKHWQALSPGKKR